MRDLRGNLHGNVGVSWVGSRKTSSVSSAPLVSSKSDKNCGTISEIKSSLNYLYVSFPLPLHVIKCIFFTDVMFEFVLRCH